MQKRNLLLIFIAMLFLMGCSGLPRGKNNRAGQVTALPSSSAYPLAGQVQVAPPYPYPSPQAQAYPSSETASAQETYPFAVATLASNLPAICSGKGEWLTYTDQVAGFTFEYPAEADIYRHPSDTLIVLKPFCYQSGGGYTHVNIQAEQNPDHLSVVDFVCQKSFDRPPKGCPNSPSSWVEKLISGERFITVDGSRAWWIGEGVFLAAQPDIFIPHGDQVIWIDVASAHGDAMVPPLPETSSTALALVKKMLASLRWIPEN